MSSVGERVGTGIGHDEARARLRARFRPWPNIGYRFTNAPGHSADITADGFVVRGLPRLTAAPVMEAVGRWRDRGAEVEVRPMLRTYLPSLLVNSLVIPAVFFVILLLQAGGTTSFGVVARVGVAFIVTLAIVALVAQLLVFGYLVLRNRGRERRELIALVLDVLGP
jgi:hypothetical protein